jgi:nucleoside-diphosphate-sugar epimerase
VTVRDEKARRELGYAPVISREEGLAAGRRGPGEADAQAVAHA